MIESYVPPVIEEDEPVFIRHAGEVRDEVVRECLVGQLAVRLENDLNHIQFMRGYGMGPYLSDEWPQEHRALLIEWEKQTRRVHRTARELTALGADAQGIIDKANYWLAGGTRKHALFSTEIESWNDMLVWRWMRARAVCAQASCEFGSIYVPLNDLAFQVYFDLGLTRWPADSSAAPVERVRQALRKGARQEIVDSARKWHPIAVDYVNSQAAHDELYLGLRLCTRTTAVAARWFEAITARDVDDLGIALRSPAP